MSLRKNTVANYIGQIYLMLIGIVVTPLYLQYLGSEAYGLVGFFALMQAWMNLLDVGLSPTLGRQASYARGIENGFEEFKRLLKSFEVIFFTLSASIIFIIYFFSPWVAQSWISAETLDLKTLTYCIMLMGIMIGLRWFVGLYRSGINGLEDQVWLNKANIFIATLKFIGALALLAFITQEIQHFFAYQLTIAVIEVLVFAAHFYRTLPITKQNPPLILFDWQTVKKVAPFAISIAYTAGVWVLLTQSDKLILSGTLTLSEFGYFSLVALVAGGVTMISGPISQAIMPRLTLLFSQGNKEELLNLYSKGSQLVTVISLSVALMVGVYAEPLIYAWTGNHEAAEWGAKILIWFALGNGILSISAFQYYLQTAFGELKLHVLGSTISALIQVPLIFYAATNYGAIGAGIAWFSFRVIWFFIWFPIVHHKFIPGFHLNWLFKEILPIVLTTTAAALTLNYLVTLDLNENRLILFVQMIALGILVLSISAMSSKAVRQQTLRLLKI